MCRLARLSSDLAVKNPTQKHAIQTDESSQSSIASWPANRGPRAGDIPTDDGADFYTNLQLDKLGLQECSDWLFQPGDSGDLVAAWSCVGLHAQRRV